MGRRMRTAYYAVVTVQAAHIDDPLLSQGAQTNLQAYARVSIMVPKGFATKRKASKEKPGRTEASTGASSPTSAQDVAIHPGSMTVATTCRTRTHERSLDPIWDESFSIPVRPESDVLVFQVFDDNNKLQEAVRRGGFFRSNKSRENGSSAAHDGNTGPAPHYFNGEAGASAHGATGDLSDGQSFGRQPSVAQSTSSHASAEGSDSQAQRDGKNLGICLLPVESIPLSGEVIVQRLQLFYEAKNKTESSMSYICVAARMETREVKVLQREDLHTGVIGEYHGSRLAAFNDRFLGIGQLAAFLYEEGYSKDIDANWDRAVFILSEQLAYRIYEVTGTTADRACFAVAKERILEDGGLWDGV